ncbi:MAG: hypothetical protein GY719_24175 [bacterium]|nr:hypothetical protein [bacterium]
MSRDSLPEDGRRPLPVALRQRLRDIPRHAVTCRHVERLYRETLSRARPGLGEHVTAGEHDPAAVEHLASCERCREVYATIGDALVAERLPLPARLARSLSSIARHPERLVPVWVSDTRYAAAACYLLAALTLTLTGDAAALLRGTTESVNSQVEVWARKSEAQSVETWDTVSSKLEHGVGAGWGKVIDYGTNCEKLFFDAIGAIEAKTDELIPDRDRSVEGEKDDRSRNDGT